MFMPSLKAPVRLASSVANEAEEETRKKSTLAGSRCSTTWSEKAPEKNVPAVVFGKPGNELPGVYLQG